MNQALTNLEDLPNVGSYSGIVSSANDDRLIEIWINGQNSENTQEAYRRDIALFRYLVKKPLQAVMLEDLQHFVSQLETLKESSQLRTRNAVKSLFTLALQLGYIRVNPAAAWKSPKVDNDLASRIMTEEDVMAMLAKEENPRNHAILRLLYNAGLRVSELCALKWINVQPNATTGAQVSVQGKGNKKRSIPISLKTFNELSALRGNASIHEYVFPSPRNEGRSLTRVQIFYIVEAAAVRAGIALYKDDKGQVRSLVSPHWLRHAHASHALDGGASIVLVRDTLGHASIETTNKYAHARPNASSSTYLHI